MIEFFRPGTGAARSDRSAMPPPSPDFALFPTSAFLYIIVCVVSIYRVDDTPSIFSSIRFDLIYFCAAKEPVESGTEQLVPDRAGRAGRERDGKTPSAGQKLRVLEPRPYA